MIEESNEIKRTKKRYPIILSLLLLLFVVMGVMLHNASKYEETDDAYVETLPVQVSSKVAGQIAKVFVEDNQKVQQGDLIAEIDPIDYSVKVEESAAKYETAILKQKNAKAMLDSVNSQIDLAKRDLDRCKNLYKDGAISKQELDRAQTKYDQAQADLTQATENILSAQKNRVADAELKQLAAQKKQAKLNLSYTKIYAPISGSITKKSIERGAYVQTGQSLLSIVPEDVWVIANFKESQLKIMKPGQDVEVHVDTYPDKIFKGKVQSIQMISGAKSSLFPPENAVGSFVKIVQRIPVKIVFAEKIDSKYNIIPGMSVVPKVRVK